MPTPHAPPSPIFLLLKHLDITNLEQKDFDELLQVVRHTPMDPEEVVVDTTPSGTPFEVSLLDQALRAMSPKFQLPCETENGWLLAQALLERGVVPSYSLSPLAPGKFQEYLPLTLALIRHYEDPSARPSLPSELHLGVRMMEALRNGGGARKCMKTLKDIAKSSTVGSIEGLHPAVWMVLQSAPSPESKKHPDMLVYWGAGWEFNGGNAERKTFFGRMLKELKGWAAQSLPASDPQLLLLDASTIPWSISGRQDVALPEIEGRWLASEQSGQAAAQEVLDLALSLPDRARGQAVSYLLGTGVALVHNRTSPSPAQAVARILIESGVSQALKDSACSVYIAGQAMWENGGYKHRVTHTKTAHILAQKEEGVREGMMLWLRFLSDMDTPGNMPTAWAGALLGSAEHAGKDFSSQIVDMLPDLEVALKRAREINSLGVTSYSKKDSSERLAQLAIGKIEGMLLASRMEQGLPQALPARTPGPRL